MEGGVKRDFRDGKNIFRRWATPICRRGRQTLEQTHIRICICKGMARRLPRFALSFCFHRRGNIGIGADLLLPLEPFWQRASWGRYTMTKGMGRGRKGGKKKEGKNATRWKGPTVRRTETNSRVEARHVEGEGEELVAGLYRVSR